MTLLHDPVRLHLAKKISALTNFETEKIYGALVQPPNPDLGELAFGCFQLAKELKKGPPVVAKEVSEKLNPDELIVSAVPTGPYINFILNSKCVGEKIADQIISGKYFSIKLSENNSRTMIEYSQPNTHKELHVGHMRNISLGNAIVRILRYSNFDIVASTFPGDMGTHVAKCLWYMKYHNKEAVPKTDRGEWLGKLYSKGHLKLEDEEGTPQEAKNKAELTAIIKQLENKTGEYYELWKETREWSIELMKSVYEWAGVKFEYWYFESDVDAESIKLVKRFKEQGKLVESQGAIGLDLNEENLGFVLLLKTDGTGLYATKDLYLALKKFEDYKISNSIYIVDTRQAMHFKQVFRTLEILGYPQAKDCYHLQYNYVELPDGAMSSRKGNIVPLIALVHQMEQTVKENYLNRYRDEWTQKEIDEVATQVAKGAIFYGMTKMDTNKKIIFDMKEWLKLDGESGPFIQYSYARIASLCRKIHFDPKNKPNWGSLNEKPEKNLLMFLGQFNTTVLSAAENYKPASLCSYLYDLAKKFNLFYHECPIANAPSEELKIARLGLSFATGEVLKKGLELLGIPAPQKM
ncbi:MAG: arginine--tRNA ligase [Proteobacteria bacterium SG_bin7]|nr:MAG: arginine--tRNA ligase [Proteobacteria bacterium SG_bin7]